MGQVVKKGVPKPKYSYLWFAVSNDEWELPVTPVFDSAKELAAFMGYSLSNILSQASRSARKTAKTNIKPKIVSLRLGHWDS